MLMWCLGEWLEAAGLGWEEAEARLGFALPDWARGEVSPAQLPSDLLIALCVELGCEIGDLVRLRPRDPLEVVRRELARNPGYQSLLEHLAAQEERACED